MRASIQDGHRRRTLAHRFGAALILPRRHPYARIARLRHPPLRYRNAPAAIEWLCQIIGFARRAVYEGPNGTIGHAELTLGGGMIMLGSTKDDAYGRNFKSPAELGGVETRSAYIVVPDPDAVYARAQAAGATIVRPIQDMDYGSREFTAKDPEGHSWSIGTYDPWKVQS